VSEDYLETPKQLAARTGLSERQIRHLIQTHQLEHVTIGCRVHIPCGAFTRFIEAKKVTPCQDEIKSGKFRQVIARSRGAQRADRSR
jgi:hypothetical protein